MDNVIDFLKAKTATEAAKAPADVDYTNPELTRHLVSHMNTFVNSYVESVMKSLPLEVLLSYARDAIENEIRSLEFAEAFMIIKNESPETVEEFKKNVNETFARFELKDKI